MAPRISAWSSVKSPWLFPGQGNPRRALLGFTDESMKRSAAILDRVKSPIARCASSNSSATNREGIASAPGGAGLPASPALESVSEYDVASGGSAIASPRATCFSALPGVSTEKCVMNCGLPSCFTWKSSFCRFSTACPEASWTTTRTGTRFACDSSGTVEVRVLISGAEAAVVGDVASGEAPGGAADGAAAGCESAGAAVVGAVAGGVDSPVVCAVDCLAPGSCAACCAGAEPAGVAAPFVESDCGAGVCCAGAGVEPGCAAGAAFDGASAGAAFGCLIRDGGGSSGASGGAAFCAGADWAWQGRSTHGIMHAKDAQNARTQQHRATR